MTTILQINSAARSQGAQSTLLADELTAKLQQSNPGAKVVVRDLLADALPHLDESVLGAFFTPADQRSAEQNAIVAKSDALIAELRAADIVVIGAPLYNFGVSSQLKSYFDWIARAGVTFRYTENGPVGLIEAAALLVKDGFKVLPYCTEDLVIGRRLLDAGCEALMPWGAPIGTGKGVVNPYGLRVLRERLPDVPLIVDAGLGVPSHACQVMEWGFDGVLLNTAVSQATHPEIMARAFAQGVEAGRAAYLAGPMDARETAHASTPVVGMPFWHQDGGGA